MPFIISGRRGRGRVLAATLGLAAVIATPAHAAGEIANPYDCAPQATLSQSFSTWNDYGQYTPVLNAGLEDGSTGWTLTGGATVVQGNEPWKIGGSSHHNALDLPAGSSAVTAPICIDQTYPYFRLFARNAGRAKSSLKIEVLYFDGQGKLLNTKPYDYKTGSTSWQPTGMVGINVFTPKTTVTAAPVAFRFTPTGTDAHHQIDDVYVDPWARG
jgi:hypothetical protein